MGRPKEFDRDQALDAATGVFREHGFEGASSSMLVQAMGIGRQSLYDTFGDKWGLYSAAVERYCQTESLAHLEQLRRGPRALDGLAAMLERVVDEAQSPCLGVGSICEFGQSHADLTAIHAAADRALSAAIAERVRAAQAEGDLAEAVEPAVAAQFLAANISGIRIAARAGAPRPQLALLADLALRALR